MKKIVSIGIILDVTIKFTDSKVINCLSYGRSRVVHTI